MNTFSENPVVKQPAAKKKYGMLPVLTVLFLISYGLMSMLVIEQGNTIQHQRYLIGDLLKDSGELYSMKMKAVQEKNAQRMQKHLPPPVAGAPAASQAAPSKPSQTPAPSSHASPRAHTHNDKVPPRPASDMADGRRALKTI